MTRTSLTGASPEEKTHWTSYQSPLGTLYLKSNGSEITGLEFGGQDPEGLYIGELGEFDQAIRWLDHYFCQGVELERPRIRLEGSPFQLEVWQALMDIGYGRTMTYQDLAKKLGRDRGSSQAIGQAVGKNPIPILIPCHRILGTGGSLTGFGGGLEIKRKLLVQEGIILA